MLKPFGGLKKLFSPKNAFKPFKAVHKAATSVVKKPAQHMGSIFGKKKPSAPKPPMAGGGNTPPQSRGIGAAIGRAKQRKMESA